MKKIILILSICLVSNSCQLNTSEEKAELIERQHFFNECISAANNHSGLIRTFREQASPDIFNPNMRVTRDDIVKEIDRISLSYLDANGIEYNENEFLALAHEVLLSDRIKTKSDEYDEITNELLDDLMGVLDFENIDQLENDVSEVLFSEKYIDAPDDLFNLCAMTSAVFVDSAQYWEGNINEWIDSQNDDVSTKLDWEIIWAYLEGVLYADASAATMAAYTMAILGPVSLPAIGIAAAFGSIWHIMQSVVII